MKRVVEFIKSSSLTEKLLMLYVVLIPFMRGPCFPLLGPKVQYSDLVFIPLFVIGIIFIWRSGRLRFMLLDKVLFGMLFVFLLSLVFSKPDLHMFIEFAGIAYLVLMYYIVSRIIDTDEKWLRIIKLWAIVAITLSVAGIAGYVLALLSGKPNLLVEYYLNREHVSLLTFRAKTSFRLAVMFASYIHASLAAIIIWIASKKEEHRHRLLLWCGLIVCFVSGFLTLSRVTAGLSLSLFCILAITKGGKLLKSFRYITFLFCACYIILALVLTIWWIFPVKIGATEDGGRLELSVNKSNTLYYQLNVTAAKMIKDHPFLGVGMGRFNKKLIDYMDWEKAKTSYQNFAERVYSGIYKKGVDPHSTFLGWASETGILGLLGIIGVFAMFLTVFITGFRSMPDVFYRYASGVLFFTVIGFLLNGLYMDIMNMRHLWFIMALGVNLYVRHMRDD